MSLASLFSNRRVFLVVLCCSTGCKRSADIFQVHEQIENGG
jgi:hypothetical protein